MDPLSPLPSGPGFHLAVGLYREAAHWALLALREEADDHATLASLFDTAGEATRAAVGEALLARGKAALAERSFVDAAAAEVEAQQRDARAAAETVEALLAHLQQIEQAGRRPPWKKLLGLLALAAIGLAASLAVTRAREGPDLARGRPWKASSAYRGFSAQEHRCDGRATDVFFHTDGDPSPWLEIDLGPAARFSRVEMKNRDDEYHGRAVPMVLEVSDDEASWRTVARRARSFRTWRAELGDVEARYLRLRVTRRTFFHLERVSVFR
jgi:hypothetical protein